MAKNKDDSKPPAYDLAENVAPAEDVAESFLGFRSWTWDRKLMRLRSPQQSGTVWQPGRDEHAVCPGGKHEAAAAGCSCGIYAAYEVLTAAPYTKVGNCFGLVWGFGDTFPGDTGFRSSYARLAAIFRLAPEISVDASQLRRLAKLYGVPLLTPHSAVISDYQIMLRFGMTDVDAELAELLRDENGRDENGKDRKQEGDGGR